MWKSKLTGIIARVPLPSESAFPDGRDLRLNFDSHHYLSLMIYSLSNGHLDSYEFEEETSIMIEIFEMAFRFVARRVLLALLRSSLPSIRAAWEELLFWSGQLENREAFRVLSKVGMENGWLEGTINGHWHLCHAIQHDCRDLVKSLLAAGCRADSSVGLRPRQTAIVAALEVGDLDCARLLMQHCDVNREMRGAFSVKMGTNFSFFIQKFDATNRTHHDCLDLFLEYGANVDYELRDYSFLKTLPVYWIGPELRGLMRSRPLSILDYVFYFHRSLFPKLVTFSKARSSRVFSRSRALWLFEKGVHMLREYLQGNFTFANPGEGFTNDSESTTFVQEQRTGWLRVLLAEQFLLARYSSGRKLCAKTVQGLLEAGADLKSFSTSKRLASIMLCATADLITSGQQPDQENGRALLQHLLDQGFQVDAHALSSAVELQGVTILECLATHCPDLKEHGAKALAQAVELSNFEATEFLLDRGAEPNSAARIRYIKTNVFGLAAMRSTLPITKYLAGRGARPGGCPSDVLAGMFSLREAIPDLFAKVQYIVEEHIMGPEPFYPPAYLLEACLFCYRDTHEGRRIFEYLFRKGAKLAPGSPLASWIAAGGGLQLVKEMVNAGADVNAYHSEDAWGRRLKSNSVPRLNPLQAAAQIGDHTLVCWLLDLGADLNPPVLHQAGTTALREICAWDPVKHEGKMRKDKIIRLFLDKGADVNAASCEGRTALFSAAQQGDLSTALLLFKHGAKPNVIYHHKKRPQTALDAAAEDGRLDMVEFLLNADAFSASASIDGKHYDGAIEIARNKRHFAVAELIRKHAADRKRGWTAASGQRTGTPTLGDDETHQAVIQSNPPTVYHLQAERQQHTGPYLRDYPQLDDTGQFCYDSASGVYDNQAGFEADADDMTGFEMTSLSCARPIEETAGELILKDSGKEGTLGENMDWIADPNSSHCEASSRPGWGLHQPEGQVWNDAEEQNDGQIILERLDTDVFMGFSEF